MIARADRALRSTASRSRLGPLGGSGSLAFAVGLVLALLVRIVALADRRASRRPRPVRPVGPRHRRQRPFATPTTRTSRSRRSWPTSGACWRRVEPAFRTVTDVVGPGDPGADEDPGQRSPTSAIAVLIAWHLRATAEAGRWSARRPIAAPPGRHRRQRVVGPVRVDLRPARRSSRSSSPRAGTPCGPPRRARGRADDEAAGAAVPRPVRRLVPRDARAGAER